MTYAFALLFGYLLGSIPFGLVLCKMAGLGDIRKIGSGNIGATNVLRTGNKPLAIATLLLDSGKGAIAVLIMHAIFQENCSIINCVGDLPCDCLSKEKSSALAMLAGFGALLGHCYPIWLKFKGGKGVATALGILLAINPLLGGICCAIWLVTALTFRISSLAALVAIGFSPLIAHHLTGDPNLSALCAMMTAIIYLKHRENIKRLFKGEEPKIDKKK